jgi:CubicO group peptidase (beta-lactamase class C family)
MSAMKPFHYAIFLACLGSVSLVQAESGLTSGSSCAIEQWLPEIEDYVALGMQKTGVPGVAVGIVYRDKVIYLKGFGLRKAGSSAPVDADTVFQLASVSKSIASTVVAAVVSRGDVSWDDKIVSLDPDFRLSDPSVTEQVTIRDFLAHRSGLPTSAGDVLEDLGFSRPEILHQMRLLPLVGEFRKSYNYSNFPFTEGAIASAKKVNQPWENLAEDLVFRPLGMTSTSYRWSDYRDAVNKADIHVFVDGKAVPRYLRIADAEAPAGGASSSVRDMVEWLRLQLADGVWNGRQIIAAKALQETHVGQIQKGTDPFTGKPTYYGLGWGVEEDADGRTILSHSGAFAIGAATTVRLCPSDQLGIVVLTNAVPTGLPESIAATFFDLYHYGKPTRDWLTPANEFFEKMLEAGDDQTPDYSKLTPPSSPTAAQPLSSYLGTYRNDYYGSIEISELGGSLWMRLPPDGALYALTHWDADNFIYRYKGESDRVTRGVKFTLGDKPQVLVENLAIEGNGVFLKVDR